MGTTAHFDPGAQPHDHSCAAGCCSLLEEFTGLGGAVICGSLKLMGCEIAICAWSLQALNLLQLVSVENWNRTISCSGLNALVQAQVGRAMRRSSKKTCGACRL